VENPAEIARSAVGGFARRFYPRAMARPLRIEFPGAVYHVTSRGDRQEPIFNDDVDRRVFLDVVSEALRRLQADAFAYCLMGNHYHFVLRTRLANLSRIMKHLNGEYARAYNRRYDVKGHLFQGRFGAILVDRQAYLMEVCRYVELNPVRAGIVETAVEWPWSSYRAHVGLARSPQWLATNELRGHMLGREIASVDDERQAARLHADLVAAAIGVDLWPGHLRQEIFLGGEDFVSVMQAQAEALRLESAEVPASQRLAPVDRATARESRRSRALAFRHAYYVDGMTMSAIAKQANVSTSSVSRMIAMAERLGSSEA
jgi:putative transposase